MNLQDIADTLGISRSTVSRALRNDPRISPQTKLRVNEKAQEMGYKANPYLSVLMSNLREGSLPSASPIIAFINPFENARSWHYKKTHHHTFLGARDRAQELGFSFEEFHLGQTGMTGARLRSILQTRNIQAVILAGISENDPSKDFDWNGFACVSLDFSEKRVGIHSVGPDFLGNTIQAIRSLRTLGYQRIGLALEKSEMARMRQQPRMAFLEHEHSIPDSERIGFWCGPSHDLPGFARWLDKHSPDALITSDWLPQRWLQPLGLRIPEDIGVAQLEPLFYPFQNSGIDGRFPDIGAAAVDLVISQIAANEFEAPKFGNVLQIPGVWRHGWSTRDKTAECLSRGYRKSVETLLPLASIAPSDALHRARLAVIEANESECFPLSLSASPSAWKSLSLHPIANSPMEVPPWPPRYPDPCPLPPFLPRNQLRGIPFELPSASTSRNPSCFALTPAKENIAAPQNAKLSVDPSLRVRAVYFCHLSFYGWHRGPLAGAYCIRYSDGSYSDIELHAYNPPGIPPSSATHQDSWIAHPQFEAAHCKHVLLPSQSHPFEDDRFAYVLEHQIPNGPKSISSIEIIQNPGSDTALLLLGITLLTD